MNEQNKEDAESSTQRWLGYRKEIKVLDCTIRDGGLMNSSRFPDSVVRAVYDACADAGVDYMEVGYKNSDKIFSPDEYGAWRYSKESDIERIIGDNPRDIKLCAMADAEKSDYKNDIVPKEKSPLTMIRVATYIHQMSLALDMVKDAHDKGYETTLNLMAVSTVREAELDNALKMVAESPVDAVYLVDSFGSLYGEQVQYMISKYMSAVKAAGKEVGMHAHNNLQMAFSNTIEAIVSGANMLDATMGGLGRGAGNCGMELLIGFLHNPKYRVRPVLHCIDEVIEPMRKKLGWGFDYPYMITGFMNRHPRSAIEYKSKPHDGKLVDFYDEMLK